MTKLIHSLPAGTYVLESADDALTPDEERGLIAALDSIRAGRGVDHDSAREALHARTRT